MDVTGVAAASAMIVIPFLVHFVFFFNHKCDHLTQYANQTKEHIFYIQVNVDVV